MMTTSPTTQPVVTDPAPTGAPGSATADQVFAVFEFLGLSASDERVQQIAAEIESGERNLIDVRNDLMQWIADQDPTQSIEDVAEGFIRSIFDEAGVAIGTAQESEQDRLDRIVAEVLAGRAGNIDTGRTFSSIRTALEGNTGATGGGPTTTIQDVVLPSDVTRLLKVTGESGVGDEYYVQGDVYGQTFSFLVGDQEAFDAMFPDGVAGFDGYETMTRSQFTNSDMFGFVAGTIDNIIGSREPLQGQVQRDLEALGLEGLPSWMANDQQAMLAVITANSQGWSPNRLMQELSTTVGFKDRFSGFNGWYDEEQHGSMADAINRWVGLEDQFRTSLQSKRGRNTDISVQYLGGLISSGWGVAEFTSLLEGEQQLKTNAAAMENLNELLQYSGQPALSADEMVDFLMQGEEFAAFEMINDALRGAELEEQGINLTTEQLEALGEGTSLGVAQVGAFSEAARAAALEIGANLNEIQRGKLGVSDELIVAVAFQDRDLLPSNVTLAEAELTLQQLGRERAALGRGTGGPNAYQDNQGRLRIPGLGG
jgi:hypothetical protein